MSRGNRFLPVPVVLAMALLASNSSFAFSGCVGAFAETYPASQTDDAFSPNQGCPICHQSSGFNMNAYGENVRTAARAQGMSSACSAADLEPVLAAVEAMHSDGEGNSNIDEITAGTQPGWCVTETPGCANVGTPPLADEFLDPASSAPPANNPPMEDAGGPYSGAAGSTLIQFYGSGSTDPDGDNHTFVWEFGDVNIAIGMMPTHT